VNLVYVFFILVVMGLCSLGALVTGVVVWRLTRRKSRPIRIGSLLLVPVPFFLLMSHCLGPSEITNPLALAASFESEFGMRLPHDVRNLRMVYNSAGDSEVTWIKFEADPATVDLLVKRFTVSTKKEFDEESVGGGQPSWWRPERDGVTSYFASQEWSSRFSYSHAVLAHDASRHVVYFAHSAID
jgi:hypothetical protein